MTLPNNTDDQLDELLKQASKEYYAEVDSEIISDGLKQKIKQLLVDERIDELENLLKEEESNGIGFRSAVKSDVIHQRIHSLKENSGVSVDE